MTPLLLALAAVGLAVALPTLLKLFKKKKKQLELQAKQRREREEAEREAERKRQEAAKQKKIEAIKLKGGILADELNKLPNISSEKLEVLYLAATQQDIRFDLETDQKLEAVSYPTMRMDFVQVSQVSQLPYVSPNQMVYDDDLFYHKFVTDQLIRPEYYDVVEKFKRLYILWDISPSMWDPQHGTMRFPDGETGVRDMWARAMLASLLMDAVGGRAEYFLRPFSNSIHDLQCAVDPSEATRLLSWIVKGGVQASGTNIGQAVTTAVKDIRDRQAFDIRMNHILLITDGDDQCGLTREYLVKALGPDVKLHVVLIGTTYGADHPLTPYVIGKY